MNQEEMTAKMEEIIAEVELFTADDWGDFSVTVFKSIEKAAASGGHWAEFDSAMRIMRDQLGARIDSGRWPE